MRIDPNVIFATFFGFVALPKAIYGQEKPSNCKKGEQYWGHGAISIGSCEECPSMPRICFDQTADPRDKDNCLSSCFAKKTSDSTIVLTPSSSFISQASLSLTKTITNVAFAPSTPHVTSTKIVSTTTTRVSRPFISRTNKPRDRYPATHDADKPSWEPRVKSVKNLSETVAVVLSFVVALVAVVLFVLFIWYFRRCRRVKRLQPVQPGQAGENVVREEIALQDFGPNNAAVPVDMRFQVAVVDGRIPRPVQATPSVENIREESIQDDSCSEIGVSSLHLSEVHC